VSAKREEAAEKKSAARFDGEAEGRGAKRRPVIAQGPSPAAGRRIRAGRGRCLLLDHSVAHESWDGRYQWTRFVYEKAARIDSAVVDQVRSS
jgi:hypothetical protein